MQAQGLHFLVAYGIEISNKFLMDFDYFYAEITIAEEQKRLFYA